MSGGKIQHRVAYSVMGAVAAAAVGLVTANAAAAQVITPAGAPTESAPYRQLIGYVDKSTYLEASVPSAGSYVIEYDVTGVAAFDTYINSAELGYVGGASGAYQTRAVNLTAGGQLIQVVGPEGSGTASVFIVQVS